nr:hypothetical protein [Tanacetum cinerariifolium]
MLVVHIEHGETTGRGKSKTPGLGHPRLEMIDKCFDLSGYRRIIKGLIISDFTKFGVTKLRFEIIVVGCGARSNIKPKEPRWENDTGRLGVAPDLLTPRWENDPGRLGAAPDSLTLEYEHVVYESDFEAATPSSNPEIRQLIIKDEFGFVIHLEFGFINLWFREDQPVIRFTMLACSRQNVSKQTAR